MSIFSELNNLQNISLNRTEFVKASAFDVSIYETGTALPLLHQTGYLLIKDYDRGAQGYVLCIPNDEVRGGPVRKLSQSTHSIGYGIESHHGGLNAKGKGGRTFYLRKTHHK